MIEKLQNITLMQVGGSLMGIGFLVVLVIIWTRSGKSKGRVMDIRDATYDNIPQAHEWDENSYH